MILLGNASLELGQSRPGPIDPKQPSDAIRTYRVCPVFGSIEMHHAIDTGERSAATLTAMRVKLLLGENITTGLP